MLKSSAHLPEKFILITTAIVFLFGACFSHYVDEIIGFKIGFEYDIKRLLILCLGFLCISLLFSKKLIVPTLTQPTIAIFTMFFAIGLFSTFINSERPDLSHTEQINNALFLCLFFVFYHCTSQLHTNIIYKGVFLVLSIFTVFLFIHLALRLGFFLTDGNPVNIRALTPSFSNPRFLNQIQVLTVPLLLMPFALEKLNQYKRASIFFIAIHVLVLLQTQARGAILFLTISIFLLLYIRPEIRSLLIRPLMTSIAVGVLLWIILILGLPYFFINDSELNIRTNSSGRLDMWLYILSLIPNHPLLGQGPLSYSWAMDSPNKMNHPHNAPLQLAYEYGFIFSAVFCFFVCVKLKDLAAQLKHAFLEQSLFIACILGGVGYSLLSGIISTPFSQLVLAFVTAITLRIYPPNQKRLNYLWVVLIATTTIISSHWVFQTYNPLCSQPPTTRIWANSSIKNNVCVSFL
jgi:O-antigen ligase